MKTFRIDLDRFGIRARLLTLLLPGILGLLALDSWNDYRALRNLMQDAYDHNKSNATHNAKGAGVGQTEDIETVTKLVLSGK